MSRVYMIFGFLGFALIAQVAAHGHLSIPRSRDMSAGADQSTQNAPNVFPLGSDFVCRNYPASPESEWTTLNAGSVSTIRWDMEAAHPGDCFAYLTYDADLPDTQKRWFKIATFVNCNMQNSMALPLNIPSYLPACDHCILRWEWYALHVQQVRIVEYYAQCADVKIVSSIAAGSALPTPQVTIPGHLPMDWTFYRPGYGTGSDDYSKVVGPPIATIGGASYNCVSTYSNACNVPTPTGNPCTLSYQRCIDGSTFQACGIGRTNTEWGPAQSCQTGLVCRSAYDDTRIICDRPSSTPTPAPSPTPVSSTSTSTTGASRPVTSTSTTGSQASTSTTGSSPQPSSTSTTGSRPASSTSTTGSPRPASSTSTSTTGSVQPASSTSTSTTGSARPVTSTSGNTGSTFPLPCIVGDQVCDGNNHYRTCSPGRDSNYWPAAQPCQTGLSCHPSATGNNIYCY